MEKTLFEKARAEVVEQHRFFVDWFVEERAGRVDFDRFDRSMGDGFCMITPSGSVLDRDAVIDYVRACRATCDAEFTISIEDVWPGWQTTDAIVVHYIEAQLRGGKHSRRQASAIFTLSASAPEGVEWRHLHETWLQAPQDLDDQSVKPKS